MFVERSTGVRPRHDQLGPLQSGRLCVGGQTDFGDSGRCNDVVQKSLVKNSVEKYFIRYTSSILFLLFVLSLVLSLVLFGLFVVVARIAHALRDKFTNCFVLPTDVWFRTGAHHQSTPFGQQPASFQVLSTWPMFDGVSEDDGFGVGVIHRAKFVQQRRAVDTSFKLLHVQDIQVATKF